MALLDIFTGQQGSSGRVPPMAKALAGLLSYSKLQSGGAGAGASDYAERLEDFFKPSASGGPTAKGKSAQMTQAEGSRERFGETKPIS